jgi:putative ABC transport system substrate-binding protein
MKLRRRDLIVAGLAGAVAWPSMARPQSDDVRRVVVLTNVAEDDLDEKARLAAFVHELNQRGWAEGRNVHIDYRWTAGAAARPEVAQAVAAEVVGLKPHVIFVIGTTTVSIILQQTRSIPVVFVTGADPVQVGFVESFARPGGNATGFADFEDSMGTKWLQLLKEVAPTIARAVFLHSQSRASLLQLPPLQRLAESMGVQLFPANVRNRADIEQALDAHAGDSHLGLILAPTSVLAVQRQLVIERAAQYRFPAIYYSRRYSAEGGLMSYGVDRIEQYRRAASYVDRILKGAKPGDLPVQQLEKYEFVLNSKTAKALGLDVPRNLLARVDEIIE